MTRSLDARRQDARYRSMDFDPARIGLVDFASNDYLGLARDREIAASAIRGELSLLTGKQLNGSTGSRLLTGCSAEHDEFEAWLAQFHGYETATLYSSGYAANSGTIACLPSEGDAVIFDELSHNSTRFGIRRGRQRWTRTFAHNDVNDLVRVLQSIHAETTFVCVESLYSMDGDCAPLEEIAAVCVKEGACLVVDEAHATGVAGRGGRGMVDLLGPESRDAILCSIHTFGKALGCHGAAVLGSKILRDYLVNYSQPLIYSTA